MLNDISRIWMMSHVKSCHISLVDIYCVNSNAKNTFKALKITVLLSWVCSSSSSWHQKLQVTSGNEYRHIAVIYRRFNHSRSNTLPIENLVGRVRMQSRCATRKQTLSHHWIEAVIFLSTNKISHLKKLYHYLNLGEQQFLSQNWTNIQK